MSLSQEQFKKARDAGYTTDQIIAFEKKREGGTAMMEEPQPKEQESISTKGMSYVKEHPFKSFFEPAAKTVTGKSLLERSQAGPASISGNPKDFVGNFFQGLERDIGAMGADIATTPASLVTGGLAGTPFGQVATKTVSGALTKSRNIPNIFKSVHRATKGQVPFAGRVREAFINKKIEVIKGFGDDLDRLTNEFPDRTVSLTDLMKEVQATAPYDQKLTSFIKSNEQLRKLVDNPELANNMPVKEVQVLLNKINSKIQGKQGVDFLEVKDFVHDIKAAQLDAFPEMAQTKETYAKIAEPYRLIKSKIKEGSLLKNLANKFGDPELNARAESLMSKDLKAEVDSYRRTKKMLETMGYIGKGTAVGAGMSAVGAGAYSLTR